MSQAKLKWSKYIPMKPFAKQLAFMSLPHEEAFYGGAAGGGKSEALLAIALQYVDIPTYKALILRRTYADMKLPSSILNRAIKGWLAPFIASGEIKYRPSDNHTLYFPSGAQIAFGYCDNVGDEERYQGSEYNTICFDELTHFHEKQYVYLFSRLRKGTGVLIPARMRSASNPGSVGMRWVRDRFKIKYDPDLGRYIGHNDDAPFIPAYLTDNPYIDQEQYTRALHKLGKVERERLLNGDWDINDEAQFQKDWFKQRYFLKSNGFYCLETKFGVKSYSLNQLYIFTTVDCAASKKTGVKGLIFTKSRPTASHSVIATWGLTPDQELLWLDNWRFQVSIPELCSRIEANHKRWKPLYNIIEKNGPGQGVFQVSERRGLPLKGIFSSTDKIKNSVAAQLRSENGKVWLPNWANWLPELEDELYSWVGDPNETDDQIDVLSNACNEAMSIASSSERDNLLREGVQRAVPYASAGSTQSAYFGMKNKETWGAEHRRNPLPF